jgi:CO dehydrogenase maturation factor
MTMAFRIAVAGKGGTGKSTLAAMLCRSLLKQGTRPLLVVDADPNSCLPEKLGIKPDRTMGDLREELRDDPEKVPAGISKTEWIERLINQEVAEASGFDMVVMGRQEGPSCYCYINNLLRNCLDKLGDQYAAVIIDNEAGMEHISRRSNGAVDVLLILCQPNPTGARTAARIIELADSLDLEIGRRLLVLNSTSGTRTPAVQAAFDAAGLHIDTSIPLDPAILDFDAEERSLIELPEDSPAAQAVDRLAEDLMKEMQR